MLLTPLYMICMCLHKYVLVHVECACMDVCVLVHACAYMWRPQYKFR